MPNTMEAFKLELPVKISMWSLTQAQITCGSHQRNAGFHLPATCITTSTLQNLQPIRKMGRNSKYSMEVALSQAIGA